MSTEPEQGARASDELARFLLNVGSMTPDWAESFRAVPRAWFLPSLFWSHSMTTGTNTAVNRYEDPDEWEAQAHANVPIVTQWDDGKHLGTQPGAVPTSSASMPSVVVEMLRDLDVTEGMNVLEVGTGTGWNAGLLTRRLGGGNVVTVEVDPVVCVAARTALSAHGLRPQVVRGDGADGYVAAAPYDRVIVTAGVRQIPAEWLRQTRSGGVVLAPWGTHYANDDALVKLTVRADGSASGPFLRPVAFMKLRDQRLDWGRFGNHVTHYPGDAEQSWTGLGPDDLGGQQQFHPARLVVGMCVPGVAHVLNATEAGVNAWFFSLDGPPSWAAVEFRRGEPAATVYQHGPRRLWDEVERSLRWWADQGRPPVDRFGLTVTPSGAQRPWFADPTNAVPSFNASVEGEG